MALTDDDRSGESQVRTVLCYDILEKILLDLPVKSLLRFKSVSKKLRDLISDPRFVKQYDTQHANYNVRRIHLSGSTRFSRDEPLQGDVWAYQRTLDPSYERAEKPWTVCLPSINSDSSEVQTDEMHNPFGVPIGRIHVLGSCNGLLFTLVGDEIFLWNPSIRDLVKLPKKKFVKKLCAGPYPVMTGLGYNSLRDEYKAVLYFKSNEMFVYNSRVGYWNKTSHDTPEYNLTSRNGAGIVVNGCPHWVVLYFTEDHDDGPDFDRSIVFFDTVDDKFKRVPTPQGWNNDGYQCGLLARRLCVTRKNQGQCTFDVWVMNEYGLADSWAQLFMIPVEFQYNVSLSYLGFSNNGEELVLELVQTKKIVSYNLKTGKEKFVMRSTCNYNTTSGFRSFAYVNSLASPSRFAIKGKINRTGREDPGEAKVVCIPSSRLYKSCNHVRVVWSI